MSKTLTRSIFKATFNRTNFGMEIEEREVPTFIQTKN